MSPKLPLPILRPKRYLPAMRISSAPEAISLSSTPCTARSRAFLTQARALLASPGERHIEQQSPSEAGPERRAEPYSWTPNPLLTAALVLSAFKQHSALSQCQYEYTTRCVQALVPKDGATELCGGGREKGGGC